MTLITGDKAEYLFLLNLNFASNGKLLFDKLRPFLVKNDKCHPSPSPVSLCG